ncbi:MAG: methyltransferase family protein [Candidatus Hodarchaeales archaeon]|jgi:protein-S-isoprenylcysteine O-methyltransferase Ste14
MLNLLPEFELGLSTAWIFSAYLFFFVPLYFLTSLNERDLPAEFSLTKKEERIELAQNILRPFVFLLPVFLPLKLGTVWFEIGLLISIFGMVLYGLVWVSMITTPLNEPLTKGIYRFSRHPGHLTPYIIFIGVSLVCISWQFFLLSTAFIVLHALSAIPEERADLEKYGEIYQAYQDRTPRWVGIPRKPKSQ